MNFHCGSKSTPPSSILVRVLFVSNASPKARAPASAILLPEASSQWGQKKPRWAVCGCGTSGLLIENICYFNPHGALGKCAWLFEERVFDVAGVLVSFGPAPSLALVWLLRDSPFRRKTESL